jgi:hypothetical protein
MRHDRINSIRRKIDDLPTALAEPAEAAPVRVVRYHPLHCLPPGHAAMLRALARLGAEPATICAVAVAGAGDLAAVEVFNGDLTREIVEIRDDQPPAQKIVFVGMPLPLPLEMCELPEEDDDV